MTLLIGETQSKWRWQLHSVNRPPADAALCACVHFARTWTSGYLVAVGMATRCRWQPDGESDWIQVENHRWDAIFPVSEMYIVVCFQQLPRVLTLPPRVQTSLFGCLICVLLVGLVYAVATKVRHYRSGINLY